MSPSFEVTTLSPAQKLHGLAERSIGIQQATVTVENTKPFSEDRF